VLAVVLGEVGSENYENSLVEVGCIDGGHHGEVKEIGRVLKSHCEIEKVCSGWRPFIL
jgi:hypothetical protein